MILVHYCKCDYRFDMDKITFIELVKIKKLPVDKKGKIPATNTSYFRAYFVSPVDNYDLIESIRKGKVDKHKFLNGDTTKPLYLEFESDLCWFLLLHASMIFEQYSLDNSLMGKVLPVGDGIDADLGPKYLEALGDYYERFEKS